MATRVPQHVAQAAKEVLTAWGLQPHMARFLNCSDGLALLAHLCNAGAKLIDPMLYEHKPLLVQYAAETHPFAWHRDGIVYIETVVGQVSFHVFEDETEHLSERETPWAGGWMQDFAEHMAHAFLFGEDYSFEKWLAYFQPTMAA